MLGRGEATGEGDEVKADMDVDMKAKAEGFGGAWRRGGWCAARTLAWTTGPGAYYWDVLGAAQ